MTTAALIRAERTARGQQGDDILNELADRADAGDMAAVNYLAKL